MFTTGYWLSRAQKGDSWAATLVWSSLSTAVNRRRLSDEEWQLLTKLLDALKASQSPNKLQAAANSALALGRRPGRKPRIEVEERWFNLAQSVFTLVGQAKGEKLDAACDEVLTIEYGPADANKPRDLRKLKKAYFANLEYFLDMQKLSRESDDSPG